VRRDIDRLNVINENTTLYRENKAGHVNISLQYKMLRWILQRDGNTYHIIVALFLWSFNLCIVYAVITDI